MNFEKVIELLESNKSCDLHGLKQILLRIANNILKNPEMVKFTMLKKNNKLIAKEILSIRGGVDVLLIMGFMEHKDGFVFPNIADGKLNNKLMIDYLKNIHAKILRWIPNARIDDASKVEEKANSITEESIVGEDIIKRPINSEPFVQKYDQPFLHKISKNFYDAQIYADESLKENARKRIPIYKLEINAQKKKRSLQKLAKQGVTDDPSLSIEDLLLLELLRWFKEEYFTWMDQPDCSECGESTTFTHYSSDINLMKYANKVEMFICKKCLILASFPRYSDLNILMETRTGRCGEWANVFTLMCHAMGWEARLVLDETDHVWTEVYSPFQKRWIHCDPCENVCDTPLMYENGWGKSISYVIAYSPDELQDVTWRYSSQHKNVLQRRKKCTEEELVTAIIELRNERLKKFTPAKKKYILQRCVLELAELMLERKPKEDEMQGRSSGSLFWRLARGETTEENEGSFTFNINKLDAPNGKYEVRYFCASDKYVINGKKYEDKKWNQCVFKQANMERKIEYDWNRVYLCRRAGTDTGYIAWRFVLADTTATNLTLRIFRKVFKNGEVDVSISGDNRVILGLPADGCLSTDAFQGCSSFTIEARLRGGEGNEAWQHAQLFRQALESKHYTFELLINLS